MTKLTSFNNHHTVHHIKIVISFPLDTYNLFLVKLKQGCFLMLKELTAVITPTTAAGIGSQHPTTYCIKHGSVFSKMRKSNLRKEITKAIIFTLSRKLNPQQVYQKSF